MNEPNFELVEELNPCQIEVPVEPGTVIAAGGTSLRINYADRELVHQEWWLVIDL
jgi:hypothetical protein